MQNIVIWTLTNIFDHRVELFILLFFFWLDADARLVLTDVQDNAYKSLCSHNLVIMLCECIALWRISLLKLIISISKKLVKFCIKNNSVWFYKDFFFHFWLYISLQFLGGNYRKWFPILCTLSQKRLNYAGVTLREWFCDFCHCPYSLLSPKGCWEK